MVERHVTLMSRSIALADIGKDAGSLRVEAYDAAMTVRFPPMGKYRRHCFRRVVYRLVWERMSSWGLLASD